MSVLEDCGDRELCDAVLYGVGAMAEFQRRYRRSLESFLLGLCQPSDGRSREKAIEIVSQVLAECVTGNPSTLEKWRGNDHLEAFLRKVAHNRLKSWWTSREAQTEVNSESSAMMTAISSGSDTVPDREELAMAGEALRIGVEHARSLSPEGLVFMRLKGLHGVDQRTISSIWGHHEAQTSRKISEAMRFIRHAATEHLAAKGCGTDLAMLQLALQAEPSILLGDEGVPLTAEQIALLRRLASETITFQRRNEAIHLMCCNTKALEWFSGLIRQTPVVPMDHLRDASFSGVYAKLQDRMKQIATLLRPCDVRGLVTPQISDAFADALHFIRANGGTLWLLCPGEAMLEAVFNPCEPEIIGKRQPMVSGIVSLVMATSESMRIDDVSVHQHYSPAVDSSLGKMTRAMLAVPFRWSDSTCGVMTAVRHRDEPFILSEFEIFERHAHLLEKHLNYSLQTQILG